MIYNKIQLAYLFLFMPFYIFSQADTSSNLLYLGAKKDTNTKIEKPHSILHLKSLLDYNLQKVSLNTLNGLSTVDESVYYQFTEEELKSGLNSSELIAYRKNKEQLFKILNDKYESYWWYRVKSLGQFIGIPDWVIKLAQFSLLLF